MWVEERYLDEAKREISKKHPQSARLNRQLELKRSEIDEAIYAFSEKGKRLTIDILRNIVQGKVNGLSGESDFLTYATEVINDEYRLGKIGVSVRDNAFCGFNKFKQFLRQTKGEYSIYISELTDTLVRKTFGRKVFESAGENANIALMRLSELFNHSNVATTKIYLGIRQDELLEPHNLLEF